MRDKIRILLFFAKKVRLRRHSLIFDVKKYEVYFCECGRFKREGTKLRKEFLNS